MDSKELSITQEKNQCIPKVETTPSTCSSNETNSLTMKVLCGPFSASLSPIDSLNQEKRLQIDELLSNTDRIISEEELYDFLEELPGELLHQADKIEIYLRYRDIIPYSDLNNLQAIALFSTIEPLCTPSLKRRMKQFFNPEVETFSAAAIINLIAKIISNNPIHTMVGISLINYIISKIADEEEDTTIASSQCGLISTENKLSTGTVNNLLCTELGSMNALSFIPISEEQLLPEAYVNIPITNVNTNSLYELSGNVLPLIPNSEDQLPLENDINTTLQKLCENQEDVPVIIHHKAD